MGGWVSKGTISYTDKSLLVRVIVCKFQFMEGHHFLHPLLPGGRAVGVDVHPLGHLGVRLASDHPSAGIKISLR